MLNRFKMRGKLVLLFGLITIITLAIQGLFCFIQLNKAHNSAIITLQREFDSIIRTGVESIIGVLETNHQRYLDGEITKDQEMESAKKIVRDSRYSDGQGYFWVDLEDGTCAVHMNPQYEGKQRYQEQDLEGNYFIQNLIQAGNQPEGGFTEFYFTKPGQDGSFKKRGFTMKFEPYGWYISTGNYYDDLQSTIDGYKHDKMISLIGIIISSIILSCIGILLMFFIANIIIKHLKSVTERITKLSGGDLHSPVLAVQTGDELETLALATEKTIENMRTIISDLDYSMKEFSKGNFALDSNVEYIGDFKSIKDSISIFVNNISSILYKIHDSSREVASGSEQVSYAAQELSQGATEQASSIEELSATIMEISEQINKNAKNSNDANEKMNLVGKEVEQSNEKMQQLMIAMSAISNTSDEINKIIKTIEDIAFQTNILALNAAVEAARAGAAGKGFAVVADEVRNLAGKSAEAAKNTTILIQDSIKAVENGTKIADETAQSLNRVVSSTKNVVHSVGEISNATNEQSSFVNQVTIGVEQISSVVQTNSATSEESAATSEKLSEQAQNLKHLVGMFQFKHDYNGTSENTLT